MLNNNYGVYGPSPNASRNAFGSKEIRDLLDAYVSSKNANFASNPANFRLELKKTGNEIKPYTSTLYNLDLGNNIT
jgi:hypothetical protein